jgi:hypothetical protein
MKPQILVGWRSYRGGPGATSGSLAMLMLESRDIVMGVATRISTLVHNATEQLARMAIAHEKSHGVTHFALLDDDMMWPSDMFYRLLRHDVDVVSGVYYQEVSDTKVQPVAYYVRSEGFTGERAFKHIEDIPPSNKLIRVGGAGSGCLLVKIEVLKQILEKYGSIYIGADMYTDKWAVPYLIGEDVIFANRCDELGIKYWIDASVRCGHYKPRYIYGPMDNTSSDSMWTCKHCRLNQTHNGFNNCIQCGRIKD